MDLKTRCYQDLAFDCCGLTYTSFRKWMRKRPIDTSPRPLVPVEIQSPSDASWVINAAGRLCIRVRRHLDG